MKLITSPENGLYKMFSSLKQKKFRDKENMFILEGYRIVKDVLQAEGLSGKLRHLVLSEENEKLIEETPFSEFRQKAVILPEKLFQALGETVQPQGVLAIMEKPVYEPEAILDTGKRILIVDQVADPGNLGTIIRTALAAGFEGVFALKGSVDFYNPKVVRSTMGAITKIPLLSIADGESLLAELREKGFRILGADITGDITIYQVPHYEKLALVLGSEAFGSHLSTAMLDHRITIPMDPKAESLNVAMAAGIIMYSLNKYRFEKL